MEQWYYFMCLTVSLTGLLVIDRRFGLAFWHDARRTLAVLVLSIVFFVFWDIAGINAGVFFHGGSEYSLPFRLFAEFPLEELAFLTLLTYTSLLLYLGGKRI